MVVSKFQIKNCTTNSVNVVDTFFANKFTVYDSDENNEQIGQSPYDSNGPESQNKQADKGRENRGKYKSRQLLLKWQCSFRCSLLKTFLLVSNILWFLIFKRNFEVKKIKENLSSLSSFWSSPWSSFDASFIHLLVLYSIACPLCKNAILQSTHVLDYIWI